MLLHKVDNLTKASVLAELDALRALGHFDESHHPSIDEMVNSLGRQFRLGLIDRESIVEINRYYGEDFLSGTLQGQALLKQFGYAGDFLMIDQIYTGSKATDPFYASWDHYFMQSAAVKAVRNRKAFFKEEVAVLLKEKSTMTLLNLASGPARDLLETYATLPPNRVLKATCVEMDAAAISYAKALTTAYASNIEFINRNVFRFDTADRYDIVWSAGLFDYFDDRAFVLMLKKMSKWTSSGGKIIIGNFNADHNPSRDYMELLGEWELKHRTAVGLIQLGLQAGFSANQLTIEREAEGVNLFLVASP